MKIIDKTITLEDKKEPLTIVPIGDIHLGADGCNIEYLKNTIEWIRTKENCVVIGMGDYCDCITIGDKRFDIKSIDKRFIKDLDNLPMAQLKYLEKLLMPIKDKILCMIPGNHESKFRTHNSLDIMHELNRDMGIEIGDYMSYLTLKFNKSQFHTSNVTLWLTHGWFSGRKLGGKANQLMDVANSYEASIYIAGHSHDLFATTLERLSIVNKNLVKEKKTFINSGTFMETVSLNGSSYSEQKAYSVAKIGVCKIKIYPNHRPRPDVHITM